MSALTKSLRAAIRSGAIAVDKDRLAWEQSVDLIYTGEREEEAPLVPFEQLEKCMLGQITEFFTIPAHLISAGPRL